MESVQNKVLPTKASLATIRFEEEDEVSDDDVIHSVPTNHGKFVEPPYSTDPYLLKDCEYIRKETRWTNKQRVLILASRGTTKEFRHLVLDLHRMLPHSKLDYKCPRKGGFAFVNELASQRNCNSVMLFETRHFTDVRLWLSQTPTGPTFKFQVHGVHSIEEINLTGNCLKGSRPVLSFSKEFFDAPPMKLAKVLLSKAFGVPRNHPKSQPFVDRVVQFSVLDNKIWVRQYQVSPKELGLTGDFDCNDPEQQSLIEIGPRFVLEPICIMKGSMTGAIAWSNPLYSTPSQERRDLSRSIGREAAKKQFVKSRSSWRRGNVVFQEDTFDDIF